jgi:hypothetical protein
MLYARIKGFGDDYWGRIVMVEKRDGTTIVTVAIAESTITLSLPIGKVIILTLPYATQLPRV